MTLTPTQKRDYAIQQAHRRITQQDQIRAMSETDLLSYIERNTEELDRWTRRVYREAEIQRWHQQDIRELREDLDLAQSLLLESGRYDYPEDLY